jgi:probable addiction module antidote protein
MTTRNRKAEKFARYDSADYLKTPEDVAEYLVAAFEDGGDDAAYMAHVIGIAARAHGGMTKLAKETGMTRAGLYKALSKDGNPSFDTIIKAMRVLGVRLVPQLAPSR